MPPSLERFGVDKRGERRLLDLFSLFAFMGRDRSPNATGVGAKRSSSEGRFSRWLVANKAEKEAISKSVEDEGVGLRFASRDALAFSNSFFVSRAAAALEERGV